MTTVILRAGLHYTTDQHGQLTFTVEGINLMQAHGWDKIAPIKMFPFEPTRCVVDILDWNTSQEPPVLEAIDLIKRGGVWDRAKCFGYFGFGTGYLSSQMRIAVPEQDPVLAPFCASACPLSEDCQARHKQRVKQLRLHDWKAVLWANTEDGVAAGAGQQIKDRGEATLTWPLQILSTNAKVAH